MDSRSKLRALEYSNTPRLSIYTWDNKGSLITSIKYVGVQVDQFLNWEENLPINSNKSKSSMALECFFLLSVTSGWKLCRSFTEGKFSHALGTRSLRRKGFKICIWRDKIDKWFYKSTSKLLAGMWIRVSSDLESKFKPKCQKKWPFSNLSGRKNTLFSNDTMNFDMQFQPLKIAARRLSQSIEWTWNFE